MDYVHIIASILSGLSICIPLVIKLVQYIEAAVKEKNWNKIVELAFGYMAEAEKQFKLGSEKKEWVLSMVEISAKSINYEYDDFAKEQISNLIDSACALSKEINK